MGIIIYNDQSSEDFRIRVEHPPGYDIAERDYESVHVPGRNGDILIDKGSYKNTVRTYDISFGDEEKYFSQMANKVIQWLCSTFTYARLEDSYEPEIYRSAVYLNSLTIENVLNHGGRATIEFNCKPQRFLKMGEKTVTYTSQGYLKNPTAFESRPIVTVYGSGSGRINIGGYVVGISAIDQYVTINSEIQDCYKNTINKNNTVSLDRDFPRLSPGSNNISFSGGVTKVEVIPRWWML